MPGWASNGKVLTVVRESEMPSLCAPDGGLRPRGGGGVGTHGKPKWQPRKTIVYVGLEGDKREFAGLDWAVAFLFGAGIQQFQLSSTSRFRTPAQI